MALEGHRGAISGKQWYTNLSNGYAINVNYHKQNSGIIAGLSGETL
jgi:hypothetical protein